MNSFSVIAGFIVGIVYGLLFLLQRRGAFSLVNLKSSNRVRIMLASVLFAGIRMAFLMLFLAYLLRYHKINGIPFIMSFFCAFWLVIINARVLHHGT